MQNRMGCGAGSRLQQVSKLFGGGGGGGDGGGGGGGGSGVCVWASSTYRNASLQQGKTSHNKLVCGLHVSLL